MAARFAGKVAIVTGGGSGIGAATATAFGAEGASVIVADRDLAAAESVAARIIADGVTAMAVKVDVAHYADCEAMVTAAIDRFGRLDIAFNNAGIGGNMAAKVHELSIAEWQQMMDINLTGVFHCIKAEAPAMIAGGRGGAIINTSSVAGLVAGPCMASYAAAKHGVMGLTKAAANDLIGNGIRVNAVCPGAIMTPMLAGAFAIPDVRTKIERDHPIGRAAAPEELARVVLFLASEEASFIVGHGLSVDGGVVSQ